MQPSQQAVIDSLNATLRSLQAARDSIDTNVVGYDRIIAKHDELTIQLEALRDSYAKPREDQSGEPTKHPLVRMVEALIPARPANLDVMRAYDQGVRDAAKTLQRAIDVLAADSKSFGWVIRRAYDDLGGKKYQYLSQVLFADEGRPTCFNWANSQHNATLLPVEFKDAAMSKLTEDAPGTEYEAVELFAA